MPELMPQPPSGEFQKLSADMLQYVFDLEQKTEEMFSFPQLLKAMVVSAVFGFLIGLWL